MESERIRSELVVHYDAAADERDEKGLVEFRADYRQRFAALLADHEIDGLLDLGAGTGHEAEWFLSQGLAVTALDLSPAHVELCRAKGIPAEVGDFASLPWPDQSFRAAWCMSSIMHIPGSELVAVIAEFARVLEPGGWLALGLWGGDDTEGIWERDLAEPKRFYALRSVSTMRTALEPHFEVVDLDERVVDNHSGWPYQWWLVRRGRRP